MLNVLRSTYTLRPGCRAASAAAGQDCVGRAASAEQDRVSRHPQHLSSTPAHLVTRRVLDALERFLHVEAVSGIVLLITAAAALVWANSPAAGSYDRLWHAPLTFGIGGLVVEHSLEFWINDGLMTIFFLVVGLEIRREMHEGALSNARLAALPLAAACGGIVAPALIYIALAGADPTLRGGWAIPTATDIAFAVGVLALLGKRVPAPVRVLLLALAVIDDIAAVIVIALFYSSSFAFSGLAIAGAGVLLVLMLQRLGFQSAFVYVVPGAIVWFGLLQSGLHPTLSGVILGLLTPALPVHHGAAPIDAATRAIRELRERAHAEQRDVHDLIPPLKELKIAQRELLPPVVRVQSALHPWVAYAVMPLFALANAGVHIGDLDASAAGASTVLFAVAMALVIGKPLGIFSASWLAVRAGFCTLPPQMTWRSVMLVGCLGGIGFTMAIFIATLAFDDQKLLEAAKLGVLVASAAAGAAGLALGRVLLRDRVPQAAKRPSEA